MSVLSAAASFLAGVIVSAIIRAAIDQYWSRPKPATKISGVVIGPTPASLNAEIDISYALTKKLEESILPTLPTETLTVKTAAEYLRTCEITTARMKEVQLHVQSILARPHILPAAATKDEQRRAILSEWAKYGATSNNLGTAALGTYYAEVPEHLLKPHPDEWKDSNRCRIVFPDTRTWNLSEIDVDAYVQRAVSEKGPGAAPESRREAEISNIDSRLWIYLNPDEVQWYLARQNECAEQVIGDAETLMAEIRRSIAEHTPEYVRVQLMITNDGRRALAITPYAYLAFWVSRELSTP